MDSALAFEEGTRLGSRAMFYSSLVTLIANIATPFFVAEVISRRHMQQKLSTVGKSVWLAEAILSDDSEPGDASSIMLEDTRSHRASALDEEGQDHERQFLVGNAEEDELADEVRSFRSSASMDGEPEPGRGTLGSLLHNADARMSHLDVSYGAGAGRGAEDDGGAARRGGGSLAAKAGTIMVRSAFAQLRRTRSSILTCVRLDRASTTSLLSYRNS
ncbi:hypothetical protein EIP86_003250 [Pleurotus ostreatoroseus]|nr:hypothetical protein EIP86_003250 [Pleurotus ostreatoroseus]